MKKFLGLIVLLVALAVCAAALVACDPLSGGQATPQSIEFVDKDGVGRSTYWDLGTFDHGTAYEDILPPFTLTLCYSDGSAKALAESEYTVSYLKIDIEDVPLAEMPAVPDAGYYQIVFDKDELQARMLFTVESVMRTDLTLTLEGYDPSEAAPAEYYCVAKADYDALSAERKAEYWRHLMPLYALGDEPCTLAAGEYYAYAKIPESGNYTDSYTAITPENAFTVKKAVLHYDSAVSSNLQAVFNYHSGIQGRINLGNINITTRDFSVTTALKDKTGAEILGQYVWADSSEPIDADDNGRAFPACYQVDPLLEANYTVENGSIPVTLTVNKWSVKQPQLSIDSDKAHSANEGFGPYPDNALPYAVVNDDGGYNVRIFGEWDKNTIEITVKRLNSDGSSTTNKVAGLIGTLLDDGTYKYCLSWAFIDPAEYAVTLSLKDKTNFTWYDGTTEDSVFRFEIKDKKPILAPTAHLRDSATGTDGVDFVTFDGAAHAIDFTDFTENAVYTTVNGESVYAIPETDNRAYYLLESETIAENIDSAGKWVVNVALTPAPEYTWADGSVTPVEYTCKINAYTTFFPGIKVANAYTDFDPNGPTADDAEVIQLLMNWFGVEIEEGEEGEKIPSKMETDYRNYKAAVYFTAFRDGESLAQYIGTVSNSHTNPDNFGTYSMLSFALTDIADKSAPTHYHGATEVEAGSKVDSTIYPNDDPHFSVEKISDYDDDFFRIAKVDCGVAVQGKNIAFAYATFGDCTVIRMKGTSENSAEGTSTSSEVYMIFRGGEYVGHEINTTVTAGGVSTDFFVQFALAR